MFTKDISKNIKQKKIENKEIKKIHQENAMEKINGISILIRKNKFYNKHNSEKENFKK